MITATQTIHKTARWNPIFRPVNTCRTRYRVLKGSAGSGKSVNIAQDYIKKLSDTRYTGANLLVVRKVDDTNRDSMFAELESAINRLFGDYADKVWRITRSPLLMECKTTGSRIIFRGVNDQRQREKVKSVTFRNGKLTWIWIEEATELQEADIEILDDRLRGELSNPNLYYQMTLTFNPVSATHWIKAKYFDVDSLDVLTHHSTYLDNRFIDDGYHRRMEMRRERDPEGYKVYALGEWGETGGLILTNWRAHDFDIAPERFDWYRYGQDFGYNHANALLALGGKDGELYICKELIRHECDTGEVIRDATAQGWRKDVPMWCDSSEPDRKHTWQAAGFNARGVNKGGSAGSVHAQIDHLKAYPAIHVHPSCTHTIKELQQWKWRFDDKRSLYLDEPVEFFDDAMAALRYGIEDDRREMPHYRAVRVRR